MNSQFDSDTIPDDEQNLCATTTSEIHYAETAQSALTVLHDRGKSMPTPDAAYAKVERIVKKFKALPAAERRAYNEAATRQAFILPLFEALGWNTDDPAEVSPEEKVSRGWVDFSFRLSGIPRFFLETKRLDQDLDDPRWVRQAIDYAWTKSVPWALLSNFEGLRAFNAEWKENDPRRAQFLEFSLDTYLSDFERLWWLSRPEIAAGRLDREAEKVGKKTRKEPVSQHLFDDLRTWRHELFRHLRAYNGHYSLDQLDEAVLRILNRLIFIRTAEDREVEPPRLLPLVRDLEKRGRIGQLPAELAHLFRELDATYDSDLFAEHFSEKLECEPTPFVTIIEGLYEKRGGYVRYNFNAIDADVLGTAYEQYLGYIIAAPKAAQVVEKRQKRKSQGIYYTPTFVVKYIVQQTLGRHLEEQGYNPAQPVRVLDVACGSGSFLIEAFDVLDRFLAQQRQQTRGRREDVVDYARRMEILSQNIYGVDKDEQAVAVAKLNLSLKALHARDKLPMLDNIRAGDSLISGTPDELKAAFGKNWQELEPFNWETEFSKAMKAGGFDVIVGNPPYVRAENMPRAQRDYYMESGHFEVACGRFDIHILFVEQALKLLKPGGYLGFIVPYSVLYQNYGEKLRRLILEDCVVTSIVDFSNYRVFKAATVDTCILTLRKETDARIRRNHKIPVIAQPDYNDGIDAKFLLVPQSAFQTTPNNMFRLELRGEALSLVKQVDSQSLKLGELCYCVIGAVPHESETGRSKDALIFDRPKRKTCKPYIEGKELGRYRLGWQGRYLAYEPKKMHRPKFPELFASPKIIVRNISGAEGLMATYDAEGFYANDTVSLCVKWELLGKVKASLNVKRPEPPVYATKYDPRYLLGLINSRLANRYFWISLGGGLHVYPDLIRNLPIRRIDFDDPKEKQQHDAIVVLVDEMLQLQKDYAEAEGAKEDRRHALKRRMEEVDAAIDQAVYQLYGLTEKEIKLAESTR